MSPRTSKRTKIAKAEGLEGSIDETNNRLIERYQAGDESALEVLVSLNIPLIYYMAKDYLWKKHHNSQHKLLNELVQQGTLGMLKRLKKLDQYNPKKGKLSTFVAWYVIAGFQEALIDANLIRKPPNKVNAHVKEYDYVGNCIAKLGHDPSDEDVAEYLTEKTIEKWDAAKVQQLRRISNIMNILRWWVAHLLLP